jgi:integrase
VAKLIERLNPLQASKLTKPGYYCDGAGLYLQIAKGGSKSWVLRYTVAGKAREMGLGSFVIFSLAEARNRAIAERKKLADGVDPIEAKRGSLLEQRLAAAKVITFDKAAEGFIEANESGWRSAKHGEQWRNTLATYASPVIGDLPVSTITTALVMKILQPIWSTKTETATRVRGRIEKVLDWAKVQGYRSGDNPAAWKGNLAEALPKPSKVADAGHHAALPWADMGQFMVTLRAMPGAGSMAMQLIILTATRTSEVIEAKWSEFDLGTGLWVIPKERMKGFREHRVPLSKQAQAVLAQVKWDNKTSEFVFPSTKPDKAISNMTCLAVLKRMGRSDLTVHGFRSTFRDWAAESTAYPRDVCEMALAHAIEDKSEAAYRRGDLLEKRTRLMSEWATFCDTIGGDGDVVPINRVA